SSVNVLDDIITIDNHNFETGSKVFYNSFDLVSSGLSTGEYYTYRIDDNRFKLGRTLYDVTSNPPSTVSIASSGGSNQYIGLINPPLSVFSNNDLSFDVSDSSLIDKKLRFFYDNDFKNEFVSVGSTQQFNIIGVGTIGITSTAEVTVNSYGDINFDVFYTLEVGGEILNPDTEVQSYSRISYRIAGTGQTSFRVNLKEIPERISYASSEVDSFSYSTNSLTESGGIVKIKKIFGGSGYKKIPEFTGVASSEGFGSIIRLDSNTIGKVIESRIENNGYVYPSDKTLSPKGSLPYTLNVNNNQRVSNVLVTYGGQNYFSAPQLVLVNSETRELIDNGAITPVMGSGSIIGVDVISPPKGLSIAKHEVY
ncbi:MAG: hypothetical protein ACO3UU_15860, partial [Minisyncoccia bacterium]